MPEIVLVVEGHGDVAAFPHLVGKIGAWLELPLWVKNPIRCGGWGSIKKSGGLERWVGLAVTRPDCRKVLLVVDLDDGCPVSERASIAERVAVLEVQHGVTVSISFCIREFEAWLLQNLDSVAQRIPALKEIATNSINEDNSAYRDAKGRLRQILPDGYSESSDQGMLVQGISPPQLFERDRSFRCFVRALTGFDYADLWNGVR